MTPKAPNDANPIGTPIPLGVADVIRETVGVPDQTPNFRRQIELMRKELGCLEARLFDRRRDRAGTSVRARRMPSPLPSLFVLALGLLAAAGLRRRAVTRGLWRG